MVTQVQIELQKARKIMTMSVELDMHENKHENNTASK